MATLKRPERLVADANPILAALLGGVARRIFFETNIQEFAVPEATLREVQRYLPHMALKVGVKRGVIEYALDLLPLRAYAPRTYRHAIPEAIHRIGERDAKDVDVLALALHLALPIWSNDRDFEVSGIDCFTTARLAAILLGTSSR